ncbi:TRAP transporter substrate-binding protein DctP [Hydrogenophaga sp.]|jgi:TRAP-type C4-dicarboxylate transport system substrate-binding protein|uniref:TRAP transporter substrate-binding protein DctP n=1 Tax=Hydrogenophaga sp. TaxID=1904254 RepID=UPI003F6FEA3A
MNGWKTTSKTLMATFAVAVGAVLPQLAAAQAWNLYTYMSVPANSAAQANMKLSEEMARFTNNELKIRVHLGGTLQINAANIGAAVADNVVQMGDDAFMAGAMPIGDLLRLPLMIRDESDLQKALAVMTPYIERGYDKRGIVMLGTYVWPQQTFWSRKKIASLADVRGQKLRTPSPELGELTRRLGGVSITMGTAEVSTALERGVVDGSLTASSGGAYMWKDQLKYNYQLPTGHINGHIIANKAEFMKLKPEVQTAMKQKATEISENLSRQFLLDEKERAVTMAKDGMVFVVPTAAEVSEAEAAIKPYWDQWAKSKGPEAVEALAKVRAALGR